MGASKPKLTPWFPSEVKPARPGWYQRDWGDKETNEIPDYFDGKLWFTGYAEQNMEFPSFCKLPWRGLAEPPLTDWFDADTKPVHVGVYEIKTGRREFAYAFWRGNGWGFASWDRNNGIEMCSEDWFRNADGSWIEEECRPWRGLAVQP